LDTSQEPKLIAFGIPNAAALSKSRDVIFDERINPPAKPEPPVDLSEILWDGELEYKGITRVGDNWKMALLIMSMKLPVASSIGAGGLITSGGKCHFRVDSYDVGAVHIIRVMHVRELHAHD